MLRKFIVIFTLFTVYVWVSGDANSGDKPSIKLEPFNVNDDAKKLCDEITSGKNPNAITQILCHRNYGQRNEIKQAFRTICNNQELLDKIHQLKTIADKDKNLISRLLTDPTEILKGKILDITNQKTADDSSIMGIMCTATNKRKAALVSIYPQLKKDIEDWINRVGSGPGLMEVLAGTCFNQRNENSDPSVKQDTIDAEANELKIKDGQEFKTKLKDLFRKYHDPELKKIFIKFNSLNTQVPIADKVYNVFAQSAKEAIAYVALVRSIQNRYEYYANFLKHCIKDIPNESDCVDRIVAIRCQIDLGNIIEAYHAMFKISFMDDFKQEVKPDPVYDGALRQLLGDFA